MVGANAGVGVPGPAAAAAVEDLHEAHASLDHTAGGQTELPEWSGVGLLESVEPARAVGFALQLQRLGHGCLHARGHFVGQDPGPQLWIVGIIDARETIEPAQQAKLGLLLFGLHAAGRSDERQRCPAADVEANARMLGPQIRGPVRPGAAAAIAGRHAQHDILGQVLIERAQPVGNPGADGRKGPLADAGPCAR